MVRLPGGSSYEKRLRTLIRGKSRNHIPGFGTEVESTRVLGRSISEGLQHDSS